MDKVNRQKALIIFENSSNIDIEHGSKYAPEAFKTKVHYSSWYLPVQS